MKAEEIISKSLTLLGLNDISGNTNDARFQKTALEAFNAVYSDVFHLNHCDGFHPILSPKEDVNISNRIAYDIMPYGVAAFVSAILGDGEKQQFFSSLYNLKRKSIVNVKTVKNTIPVVEV